MSIGIISEGITDQVVLTNLVCGFFNDSNFDIEPLEPKDGSKPFGWTRVFKYVSSPEFRNAFDFYDHVIIQIDTDKRADWPNHDLPEISPQGALDEVRAQIDSIKAIFREAIGTDFYDSHEDRIIFAISVETIECWILAFYGTRKAHRKKMVNCLDTLNREYLNPQHGFTIDPNRKAYDSSRLYEKAANPLRKKKNLNKNIRNNPSLGIFMEELENRF